MEYRIERYQDFTISGIPSSLQMEVGSTVDFEVSVNAGESADYSEYEILPVASDGFVSSAEKENGGKKWKITVTAPADFTNGSLSLIVSDGRGLLKTYTVEITCK